MPKPAPREVDWLAIEAAYRGGFPTVRVLAKLHGVSPALICKRAKADGWTRDLTARINADAEAKLRREQAKPSLAKLAAEADPPAGEQAQAGAGERPREQPAARSRSSAAVERIIVDACGSTVADVMRAHRNDIASLAKLCDRLIGCVHRLLDDEPLTEGDKRVLGRNDGAAAAFKMLVESRARLIDLERKAYRIDDDSGLTTEHLDAEIARLEAAFERARHGGDAR